MLTRVRLGRVAERQAGGSSVHCTSYKRLVSQGFMDNTAFHENCTQVRSLQILYINILYIRGGSPPPSASFVLPKACSYATMAMNRPLETTTGEEFLYMGVVKHRSDHPFCVAD